MIPPNTPPTSPTNYRWLWLLILVLDETGPQDVSATMMLAYLPDGDPSLGDSPDAYIGAFFDTLKPALTGWLPSTCYITEVAFYWGVPFMPLQNWAATPVPQPAGVVPGQSLPGYYNAMIRKLTARYPNGRPYFRIPFVPKSAVDQGGALVDSALIRLELLADALLQPVTSQGVTFTPASWTSKTGQLEPLTGVTSKQNTTVQMRRGQFRGRGLGIVMSSYTWSY